jgi:hypothetical protein
MTSSNRHPSVEIFSMLFGIVYLAGFYLDWALFRYYPDARTFHLKATPQDGPAILWYGWIAAAALISAAVAAIVPRQLAARLPAGATWIVPLGVVVLLLLYERRWFV